jgi:subtilisin family serine protease
MKLQTRFLLSLLILVCPILVGPSDAQQSGRYIVTIQAPAEQAAEAVMRAGGAVIHTYETIPAVAIQIPVQALPGLMRNPLVVDIEPDAVVTTMAKPGKTPPTPPAQTLPWGIDRIDAEWAWTTTTGIGVNIAIIDTGIDYAHPDLAANYCGGYDFVNKDAYPMDDNGHGTHVAGIIAAVDNTIGVIGVAPGASLYGVKVLNRTGRGWVSDIMKGVEWCMLTHFDDDPENDIDIANMSLGGGGYIQGFQDICTAAAAAGVILVAAAGNESGAVSYPAAYANVIGVSATNSSDDFASFSNYGAGVDIAAPGVSIYSTYKGGSYATMSGTSMAAPHVAGALALHVSRFGVLNAEDALFSTADDIPQLSKSQEGAGLVDAEQIATGESNGGGLSDPWPPQ